MRTCFKLYRNNEQTIFKRHGDFGGKCVVSEIPISLGNQDFDFYDINGVKFNTIQIKSISFFKNQNKISFTYYQEDGENFITLSSIIADNDVTRVLNFILNNICKE